MILVKVASGRVVPRPDGARLDPNKTYRVNERSDPWAYYLRAGDVVKVPDAPSAPAAGAAPAASSAAAPATSSGKAS